MRLAGRFLKAELVRRGVTQTEIAEAAGVDPTLVSHVIAGRRRHLGVEQGIADAVGVGREELFPAARPAAA